MGSHDPAVRMRSARSTSLFPVAISDVACIPQALNDLESAIARSTSAERLLSEIWNRYLLDQNAPFALALVAGSAVDLQNEIQFCRRTWPTCRDSRRDWKTPAGSRLTAQPIGQSGRVAYVFPGIGSLYPGYSRDLLRIFPDALDHLPAVTHDEILPMIHTQQLWDQNVEMADSWPLHSDIVSQAEATVSLAYVWTHLLDRVFQIRPTMAMGYSLGEIAMFASCGSWDRPQDLSVRMRQEPSFRESLSGDMAVLSKSNELRAIRPDDWQACVASLPRPWNHEGSTDGLNVFITHINTPREVVVAGDSRHVNEWLTRHQALGRPLPSRLVYHCQAVQPEAEALQRMFELPVAGRPQTELLAMAPFTRVPHDSKMISRALVNTALNTVDFPQIVQAAYQRGARVFIEVGPRNSCATWIQQILSAEDFIAVSTDQKGADCATSLIRLMATLVTHRIQISPDGTWNWIQSACIDERCGS